MMPAWNSEAWLAGVWSTASKEDVLTAYLQAFELSGGRSPVIPRAAFDRMFADDIQNDPNLRQLRDETRMLDRLRAGISPNEIDTIYARLGELRQMVPSPERDREYRERFARLRQLQGEEARKLERLLAARAELPIGAVDDAIRRAEELLRRR